MNSICILKKYLFYNSFSALNRGTEPFYIPPECTPLSGIIIITFTVGWKYFLYFYFHILYISKNVYNFFLTHYDVKLHEQYDTAAIMTTTHRDFTSNKWNKFQTPVVLNITNDRRRVVYPLRRVYRTRQRAFVGLTAGDNERPSGGATGLSRWLTACKAPNTAVVTDPL